MRQRNMDRDRGTRDLRTGAGTEIQGQRVRTDGQRVRTDGQRVRTDGQRVRTDGQRVRTDGQRVRTEVGAETRTRVEFRFSLSLYYTSR